MQTHVRTAIAPHDQVKFVECLDLIKQRTKPAVFESWFLKLELLGLDPAVLGHRERRQPSPAERKTVERIAEHLAVHARPRAT